MKVKLICVVCGVGFFVYQSQVGKAKCCSNKCGYIVRGLTNQKRSLLKCEYCGKQFEEHICHVDRRRFCSIKCKFDSTVYKAEQAARVSGKKNPLWKGGIVKQSDGYVYQHNPEHPLSSKFSYKLQHRLVLEEKLKELESDHHFLTDIDGVKYLKPSIHIHHLNKDKKDNRFENLIAVTRTIHAYLHGQEKKEVCRSTAYKRKRKSTTPTEKNCWPITHLNEYTKGEQT
jgi:hypothetical protein